jgi:RNA polymerase sigma factor (sigma-70 family)
MSMPFAADRSADPIRPSSPPPSAPRSTPDTRRARRLADPLLHEAVRATLHRAKAPGRLINDLISETLVRACACHFLPDHDECCRQYVSGMARRVMVDYLRDQNFRLEQSKKPFDETADTAPRVDSSSSVEARITLEQAVRRMRPRSRKPFRWLLRHIGGESYATIAGELGLDYKTVWNAAERARDEFEQTVTRTVMCFMMLLFAWALAKQVVLPSKDVADPNQLPHTVEPAPQPQPSVVPQPQGQVQTPSQTNDAVTPQAIRKKALQACGQHRWGECLDGLDQAAQLDPEGDESADVQEARTEAQLAAVRHRKVP